MQYSEIKQKMFFTYVMALQHNSLFLICKIKFRSKKMLHKMNLCPILLNLIRQFKKKTC